MRHVVQTWWRPPLMDHAIYVLYAYHCRLLSLTTTWVISVNQPFSEDIASAINCAKSFIVIVDLYKLHDGLNIEQNSLVENSMNH